MICGFASGTTLRDPKVATSYGVGEAILDAIKEGEFKKFMEESNKTELVKIVNYFEEHIVFSTEQNPTCIYKVCKQYAKEHKEQCRINVKKHYYAHKEELIAIKNEHSKQMNTKSRLSAHNHRQEWTPEDIEILIHMIKQGKSYKEISTRLGRTIQSIATRLYQLRKQGDSFNGNPVDI